MAVARTMIATGWPWKAGIWLGLGADQPMGDSPYFSRAVAAAKVDYQRRAMSWLMGLRAGSGSRRSC